MSLTNSPLYALIEQLKKWPGIGEKSAQRLTLFLLSLPEREIQQFVQVLVNTKKNIRYCSICYNLSFSVKCSICEDTSRDTTKLCIVAEPQDILALEKTKAFFGRYHVLGGLLSPLDGFHPEMLRVNELLRRLDSEPIQEILLALNPSVEGDATILYLHSVLQKYPQILISKLAHGLPMGADLDYIDELTLQKAIQGRQKI